MWSRTRFLHNKADEERVAWRLLLGTFMPWVEAFFFLNSKAKGEATKLPSQRETQVLFQPNNWCALHFCEKLFLICSFISRYMGIVGKTSCY